MWFTIPLIYFRGPTWHNEFFSMDMLVTICGHMWTDGTKRDPKHLFWEIVRYSMKTQREFYGDIMGIYLWDTCRNMIIRFVGKWRGLASNVKSFSFGTWWSTVVIVGAIIAKVHATSFWFWASTSSRMFNVLQFPLISIVLPGRTLAFFFILF